MSSVQDNYILIVDDEADVRKFLKMALEDAGFQVDTANDGFEALDKIKAKKPALISLDLVMPKRSGAKFYQDLQRSKDWKKIPVLIVTGHARDELGKADLEELTLSGPGIYLEKPVKPASYVSAVKKMLGIEETDEGTLSEEDRLKQELLRIMPEEEKEKLESFIRLADKEILRKLLDSLKDKYK